MTYQSLPFIQIKNQLEEKIQFQEFSKYIYVNLARIINKNP